nr:MAG TPA: hypothetical protein [Caudoviricetes sp.]
MERTKNKSAKAVRTGRPLRLDCGIAEFTRTFR